MAVGALVGDESARDDVLFLLGPVLGIVARVRDHIGAARHERELGVGLECDGVGVTGVFDRFGLHVDGELLALADGQVVDGPVRIHDDGRVRVGAAGCNGLVDGGVVRDVAG